MGHSPHQKLSQFEASIEKDTVAQVAEIESLLCVIFADRPSLSGFLPSMAQKQFCSKLQSSHLATLVNEIANFYEVGSITHDMLLEIAKRLTQKNKTTPCH